MRLGVWLPQFSVFIIHMVGKTAFHTCVGHTGGFSAKTPLLGCFQEKAGGPQLLLFLMNAREEKGPVKQTMQRWEADNPWEEQVLAPQK